MPQRIDIRHLAGVGVIVTPLYVDDALLAQIVLGEQAKRWSEVLPALERDGMPKSRRSVGGLYYLPAQLRFFDRREGVTHGLDYADDGPENFRL
ncbi:hypothetical protein V1281_004752 [Nitrobacteraceae bacterium AZCC 2161]